jgi:uncharacterized protein YecE (DUF72 family)
MFTAYTKVFNITEVNSTFYRYPSPRTVQGWYRNAPPGFLFSVKLPQLVTHDKWLNLEKGVEDDTNRFLDLVRPLAEKLGPILIQLRPKFNYDEHMDDLERYLEYIPRNYEWAVEFRHTSWLNDETYKLLEKHNVAFTIVDEPLLPPETHVTADFAYIRWHGHGSRPWYNYEYQKDELESWVPRVEETTREARKVYGFFNNHYSANAVKNAVEMLEMLNMETAQQSKTLKKIVEFREQQSNPSGMQSLLSYTVDTGDELSISDLLIRLTTAPRLARGENIEDSELLIGEYSKESVNAKIRSYSIDIDCGNRVITHDCDDWRKGKDRKRMCKHMAKLFLSLPEDTSRGILMDIWANMDKWRFEV